MAVSVRGRVLAVRLGRLIDPGSVGVSWYSGGERYNFAVPLTGLRERFDRLMPNRWAEATKIGKALLSVMAPAVEARTRLAYWSTEATATARLQVQLTIDPSVPDAGWWWSLPWELLDLGGHSLASRPLLAAAPVDVVRVLGTTAPKATPRHDRHDRVLRVLPVTGPRDVPGEAKLPDPRLRESLLRELGGIGGQSGIDVLPTLDSPSIEDLGALLAELGEAGTPVEVLVFHGHGRPGHLALTRTSAKADTWVGADALANAIQGQALVAVLDACHSGSTTAYMSGVAETFAAHGIHTVAWQAPVSAGNATTFLASLARSLRRGWPLPTAVATSRQELVSAAAAAAVHGHITIWQPGTEPAALPKRYELAEAERGWTHIVPRPALDAAVESAIADPSLRVLILQGHPGTGKSTYLRHLATDPRCISAILTDPTLATPDRLTHTELCARLGRDLAEQASLTSEQWEGLWRTGREPTTSTAANSADLEAPTEAAILRRERSALVHAAAAATRTTANASTDPQLLVVDGLDQYEDDPHDLSETLDGLATVLGAGFTLVCTTRPERPVLKKTTERRAVRTLKFEEFRDDDAIRTYLNAVTSPHITDNATRAPLVARVAAFADGVFLIARTLAEITATNTPEQTADLLAALALPTGSRGDTSSHPLARIRDLYEATLDLDHPNRRDLKTLLQLSAACLNETGFTAHQIAHILNWRTPRGEPDARRVLDWCRDRTVRPYLIIDNTGHIRPFHRSLTDWLLTATTDAGLTVPDLHADIGRLALQEWHTDHNSPLGNYATDHAVTHWIHALASAAAARARRDKVRAILTDPEWLFHAIEFRSARHATRQISVAVDAGVDGLVDYLAAVNVARQYVEANSVDRAITAALAGLLQGSSGTIHSLFAAAATRLRQVEPTVLAPSTFDPKQLPSVRLLHGGGVTNSVEFHRESGRLAAATRDGSVLIWNFDTLQTGGPADYRLTIEPHHDGFAIPGRVSWEQASGRLAATSGENIHIWSPQTIERSGRPDCMLPIGSVSEIAWDPTSGRLAALRANYQIAIWEPGEVCHLARPTRLIDSHSSGKPSLAWDPTSGRLACTSHDAPREYDPELGDDFSPPSRVLVWEPASLAASGLPDRTLTPGRHINCLSWAPTTGILVCTSWMWAYRANFGLSTAPTFTNWISAPSDSMYGFSDGRLSWNPDTETLAAICVDTITVAPLTAGNEKPAVRVRRVTEPVHDITWIGTNGSLALAMDGAIELIAPTEGTSPYERPVRSGGKSAIGDLAWRSNTFKILALSGETLIELSVAGGEVQRAQLPSHLLSASLVPFGEHLASCNEDRSLVWKRIPESTEELCDPTKVLPGWKPPPARQRIAWDTRSERLAIAGRRGISVWEAGTVADGRTPAHTHLGQFEVNRIKWDCSSGTLGIGTKSALLVWPIADGLPLMTLPLSAGSDLGPFAWGPSGELAISRTSGEVFLWSGWRSLAEGRPPMTSFRHSGGVFSMDWDSSSGRLATGYKDLRVWSPDGKNAPHPELVYPLNLGYVTALQWDNSGGRLAFGTLTGFLGLLSSSSHL